jgi:putative intracellular protease/amidase
MVRRLRALILGAVLLAPTNAVADQAVSVGGALALLNKPGAPRASVILIPGGDGALGVRPDGSFSGLAGNQLVRTRKNYLAHGVATLTIDSGVDVSAAVAHMRAIARPVVIVATSRGSLRVAGGLSAKPDGIVLTAAFLDEVKSHVGSPGALPPTLIVHHRQDGCRLTPPSAVEPFKAWGGSKVRVAWMEGGSNSGNPCQARAYHGFNGIDGRVVSTVAQFALSRR